MRAGKVLSQSTPAQGSVRVHTAPRGSQVPQEWDCKVTRARQLFVTSPLQVLPVRTAPLVTTTALLNLRLYEHQHIIPSFIPCLPRACQGAQCPLSMHSTDEPPLTANFTTCVSLLTQYTQVPCFLPRSGVFFKLIQDLIHRVYSTYWMNSNLQEVFTSGKPC